MVTTKTFGSSPKSNIERRSSINLNSSEWQAIEGYQGRYWICSDGRIYSKEWVSPTGKHFRPRFLKIQNEHYFVTLTDSYGNSTGTTLQYLLATYFVPNPYNSQRTEIIDPSRPLTASNVRWKDLFLDEEFRKEYAKECWRSRSKNGYYRERHQERHQEQSQNYFPKKSKLSQLFQRLYYLLIDRVKNVRFALVS